MVVLLIRDLITQWCVKTINLTFIILLDAFDKVNKLFHPNLCKFLDEICLMASHLLKLVAMLCFLFQHVRLSLFKSRYFLSQAKDNCCRGSDSPNVASRKFVSRSDWLCVSYQRFDHKVIDFWKGLWGDIVVCPHQKEKKTAGKREEEDFHLGLKERLGLGVEVVLTCRTHKRGFFSVAPTPRVLGGREFFGRKILWGKCCW